MDSACVKYIGSWLVECVVKQTILLVSLVFNQVYGYLHCLDTRLACGLVVHGSKSVSNKLVWSLRL